MRHFVILLSSAILFFEIAIGRPPYLAKRVTDPARRASWRISSIDSTQDIVSSNWAGALISPPPPGQTFATAIGTFTIPCVHSADGAASIWVGIDGNTTSNPILRAGVRVDINGGKESLVAFAEWFGGGLLNLDDFAISVGNTIRVTVHASSPMAGTATMENLGTRENTTVSLFASNPSVSLRGENAEWIIEAVEENFMPVPLADFDTVIFSGVSASTAQQSVGPVDATVINMAPDSQVATTVTISGSTVTIKHT